MNTAISEPDNLWVFENPGISTAENIAFLAICAVILASTFFALIAPQKIIDIPVTLKARIVSASPSIERQAEPSEEKREDRETPQQSTLQHSPELELPEQQLPEQTIREAMEPERALDLSLPKKNESYLQFGVMGQALKREFRLRRPSGEIDGAEDNASTPNYESYTTSSGEVEVRINDRCRMTLGTDSVFSNSDNSSVALVKCGKRNKKRDLDRLFKDIKSRHKLK